MEVVVEVDGGGVVMISQKGGVLGSWEFPSRKAFRIEKRACMCA